MVVVLELWPFEDEKTEPGEDGFDALAQEAQGMTVANGRRPAGQCDIDRALGRTRLCRRFDACTEDLLDVIFSKFCIGK